LCDASVELNAIALDELANQSASRSGACARLLMMLETKVHKVAQHAVGRIFVQMMNLTTATGR
jgi:hypothetical protein